MAVDLQGDASKSFNNHRFEKTRFWLWHAKTSRVFQVGLSDKCLRWANVVLFLPVDRNLSLRHFRSSILRHACLPSNGVAERSHGHQARGRIAPAAVAQNPSAGHRHRVSRYFHQSGHSITSRRAVIGRHAWQMLHAGDAAVLRDPSPVPRDCKATSRGKRRTYGCASKTCGAERPRMYFVVQCGFAPQRLYAGFSAAASSQMLRSRVSGIRNKLSTKQIAGTAIG